MDGLTSEESADWGAAVNTTAGIITSTSPVNLFSQQGSPVTGLTFFLGTIYALIILVSFVGNLMVVVVILSTHKLKTTTNYLLMALAVADLTVTVGELGADVKPSCHIFSLINLRRTHSPKSFFRLAFPTGCSSHIEIWRDGRFLRYDVHFWTLWRS